MTFLKSLPSAPQRALASFFLIAGFLLLAHTGTQAQMAWVQFTGSIPSTAVVGGTENGQNLYIGRATHSNGTVHPGKVFRSGYDYICNYGYGGKEVVAKSFEILVQTNSGVRLKWEPVSGSIPADAVTAGTENGQYFYVGRASHSNGTVHPGKIFAVDGQYICNYGYGGKEVTSKSGFQVLVAKSPAGTRKKMITGTYRIQVKANGRYWHEDGGGDKLVSTRYQPTDDFTRFTFEPQEDGSYRIKVVADSRYLHHDGLGDKLLSTRYQPNDDYTRLYLEP
ncbi:MAG: DUF3421 domain-containing protein, partial [Phaeodactylibacter sp.]|nr:DUF3421 domain-containing protein [Phaeodactylibacter sp.]